MSFEENKNSLLQEFRFFENWEEKYEYIIDLGRSLLPLKKELKSKKNLIRGCQARVWLVCSFEKNKFILQGDSDAIITKGLVGLLIRLFSGCSAEEIVNSNNSFINELGLNKHLSITRANGINEMLKGLRLYCLNYLKNE